MILKWLLSRTVRQAVQMYRHVGRLLHSQRDILEPQAFDAIQGSVNSLRQTVRQGASNEAIAQGMENLEQTANKRLIPHAYPGARENVEVMLVAIAVAMAIRTFFLQPFKIPTGSMQPTLYGITHDDLRGQKVDLPNPVSRLINYWIRGESYLHVVARAPGQFTRLEEPARLILFNLRQTLWVGDESYTIWFPPDNLAQHCGLIPGQTFKAGEDVIFTRVRSGDHLFVDRLTYNFRRPTRGEIIVFQTQGVHTDERFAQQDVPQDQFYIKRLVGLGGERLKIGEDQHLNVDGRRLDSATPHFENIYDFKPGEYKVNHYFGHVPLGYLGNGQEFIVPPKHYVVMGDNTRNSLDSRYWGSFPQENVIGRYWFVYWPITERFGWAPR